MGGGVREIWDGGFCAVAIIIIIIIFGVNGITVIFILVTTDITNAIFAITIITTLSHHDYRLQYLVFQHMLIRYSLI